MYNLEKFNFYDLGL